MFVRSTQWLLRCAGLGRLRAGPGTAAAMDPSEFEGCVSRQGQVLHAGKFEELLTGGPTSFTHLDLSKESGDVYLSIFNLQQAVEKIQASMSMDDFSALQDDQAIKLAELKEDYVKRRKVLAGKVKAFTTAYLEVKDPEHLTVDHALEMIDETGSVMDTFKKEFDNLAQLAKFSENAFLGAYKRNREMPNVSRLLDQSLSACLRLEDVLKRAQEQLNIADTLLTRDDEPDAPTQSTAKALADLETLRQRCEAEKEELRQRYQSDLTDLKARFEVDQRNRENALNNKYEQQQLDAQHRTDAFLASKEAYVASLLHSLQDYQQKALLFEGQGRALEAEDHKRKHVEEKLRDALVANADLENAVDQSRSELRVASQQLQAAQAALEAERQQREAQAQADHLELQTLRDRLASAEEEIAQRPPVDIEGLAGRIGFALGQGEEGGWAAVETYICETMRRQGSELISLRLRDQEQSKQLERLVSQAESVGAQLRAREAEVHELEREIHIAQQANRASRALPAPPSPAPARSRSLELPKDEDSWALDLGLDDDALPTEGPAGSHLPSSSSTGAPDCGGGGSDQVVQVLQHQRDRYMRTAQGLQSEAAVLRSRVDRMQDEQTQLRNENLELYRRLRVLRVNAAPDVRSRKPQGAHGYGHDSDDEEAVVADPLDHKYRALYEEGLSPFQVAELDKRGVLGRLGAADRALAYLLRVIVQDAWTRQAFLGYLVLVHLFALVYCFQVLNPELDGELDALLKARYSQQTLDLPEHPDA